MGSCVAAQSDELTEAVRSCTTVVEVSFAHSVVVSDRVARCAGSVAGFTAEQVEEVRMVVRMFPIFLTTIFYWTIYSQVQPLAPPCLRLPVARSPPRFTLVMHIHVRSLTIIYWTVWS